MKLKVVGVIGAGVMGTGVAIDLSYNNYEVILKDLTDEQLQKAQEKIEKDFKVLKMIKKEFGALSVDTLLSRIRFVTDYEGFGGIDMVIENISEAYEAKKVVYKELNDACRKDVLYGVNTSCISITKIGSLMPQPENVIGMHFMNPVPLKELVEIVKGHYTSEETVEKTKRFLKSIGKTFVVVNDFPGFVTNRVLMVTINESIWLLQDNVAEPKDIDIIFKLGVGHKMGPLATADLIGLDTVLNSLVVLHESYHDSKYRPCPLLVRMVDAGLLGKKSGKGFFEYSTGKGGR